MAFNYRALMKSTASAVGFAAVCCLFMAGCARGQFAGDRERVVPVKGQVTFNGQPLEGAQVTFRPEESGMPPAYARTGRDGRYELTTYQQGDGAVPGLHQVTVTHTDHDTAPPVGLPDNPDDPEAMAKAMAERYRQYGPGGRIDRPGGEARSLVPSRYANFDTSGLTARVTEGGGEFSFELTD